MSAKRQLFVLGCTHQTAPLEVREQFAVPAESAERLYQKLGTHPAIDECLILNTCNRIEIYGITSSASPRETITRLFCEFRELDYDTFSQYSLWLTNQDAAYHLYKVVCGIDSQLIGETEILGQVKQAYEQAREQAHAAGILNKLFQKSFQTAKWIRTNTAIGKGQTSIGNVAADLALRIFGELDNCSILIVGSGEIGEQAVTALKNRGNPSITVSSRTLGRARMMAAKFDGVAVEFDYVKQVLRHFDIVVCATAAQDTILSANDIERAMQTRLDKPLFLMDLAVPRDVGSEAGSLSNVYLYNITDLSEIANQNLRKRQSELKRCKQLIGEKAEYLWTQLNLEATQQADSQASHRG